MSTVREIRITVMRHQDTNALFAVSEDLKGLMVQAMTHEELQERVPVVVRDLLELQGASVESVERKEKAPPAFVCGTYMMRAQLAAA